MKLLVRLLSIPLETLSIAVLKMHHYPALMDYMKFSNKRTVAVSICKAVIKDRSLLSSLATVDQLLSFIKPLLGDDDQGKEETYEFEEGQELVAKLVHMAVHPSNKDYYFEILLRFKKVFVKGGINRMRHTIPALIFALIKLSVTIQRWEHEPPNYHEEFKEDEEPQALTQVSQKRVFKLIAELLTHVQSHIPEIALRLNL